jgi:hypothetical protein
MEKRFDPDGHRRAGDVNLPDDSSRCGRLGTLPVIQSLKSA